MENEDRREYKRYPVTEEAYVFCLDKVGRVIDVSKGGMTINLFYDNEVLCDNWACTFSCRKTDTKVNDLRLIVVREEIEENSIFSIPSRTVGVKFDDPSSTQQTQILEHIVGASLNEKS